MEQAQAYTQTDGSVKGPAASTPDFDTKQQTATLTEADEGNKRFFPRHAGSRTARGHSRAATADLAQMIEQVTVGAEKLLAQARLLFEAATRH